MRDQFPSDLATYKVIHIYFTRDGNSPRFSFADLEGKNPPNKIEYIAEFFICLPENDY